MLARLLKNLFSPQGRRTSFERGEACAALGDWTGAAAHWRQSLAHDPDARAAARLSRALIELDRLDEASGVLARALDRDPTSVELRVAYADPLRYSGRIEDAVRLLREGREIASGDPELRRALLHLLPELCDWTAVEQEVSALRALIARQADAEWTRHVAPIDSLLIELSPEERRRVAVEQSRRLGPRAASRAPRPARRDRIRVGYLSGDFRDHAVAHLTQSMFARHDRGRFEVHAFSYGRDDGSAYRRVIADTVDTFHELRGFSDPDAGDVIRRAGIDVLIDLAGHAPGNRLGILAHRPAPVQLHYLGYPGTTGAPFVDYFVTDAIALHPAQRTEFTEKFLVLPGSFLISEHRVRGVPQAENRAAHGLPPERFVFCNFGRNSRIHSRVFDVWMEILRTVPESVLWLKHNNAAGTATLKREAARHEVDPARLIFAPDVPDKDAHLARLAHADLFLDTFGRYNAHTTTADALWSGVPVLTTPSESFAGRVAASALHAAGLAELVATSPEEYAALAVQLSRDRERLSGMRRALDAAQRTEPFFDTARTVRALEQAYDAVWEAHGRGDVPREIELT